MAGDAPPFDTFGSPGSSEESEQDSEGAPPADGGNRGRARHIFRSEVHVAGRLEVDGGPRTDSLLLSTLRRGCPPAAARPRSDDYNDDDDASAVAEFAAGERCSGPDGTVSSSRTRRARRRAGRAPRPRVIVRLDDGREPRAARACPRVAAADAAVAAFAAGAAARDRRSLERARRATRRRAGRAARGAVAARRDTARHSGTGGDAARRGSGSAQSSPPRREARARVPPRDCRALLCPNRPRESADARGAVRRPRPPTRPTPTRPTPTRPRAASCRGEPSDAERRA